MAYTTPAMSVPLKELKDEELAALVQGNNEEALGVLIDRYEERLLRYGRRFLPREANIVDAVQDVFIKVYENIRSFDATKRFGPWIYRIAHNEFISTLRAGSRAPVLVDWDEMTAHPSYEYQPAEEEEKKQLEGAIERGLSALPEAQREVVIPYSLENLTYQEISDILRTPLGTVGVRLRRARQNLKKYVDR